MRASWAFVAVGVARADPRLDMDDSRFFDFHTPEVGDSRCACPALNSLANHGFLPTNGRGVNITDIIVAAFEGFGVSPETSALITMDGLVASNNAVDLVFNLEDLQRASWRIEHDCSFSRPDASEGAGFPFDQQAWDSVADVLAGCDAIGPLCLGRAKAVRIAAQRAAANEPPTNYDAAAAAHGAAEVGMLLGVFSTARSTADRLVFIRSLFENEAIPRHLGWEPREFLADVDTVLDVAAQSLQADPVLRQASDATVVTRADVIRAIKPANSIPVQQMSDIVRRAGFNNPAPFESIRRLAQSI